MKYIIILRGINVAGKNIIKMASFRELLTSKGFKNVATYIQSGNIALETSINSTDAVEKKISDIIKKEYDYVVPIIVITKDYILNTIESLAFDIKSIDITKLHVTFLKQVPDSSLQENIESLDFSPDKFIVSKDKIYVYCPNGYGRTKINNNFFERKLKVQATTRNWKSVLKLGQM